MSFDLRKPRRRPFKHAEAWEAHIQRVLGRYCFLQDDQAIANAPGATVRADINNNLQALVTLASGAAAPATTWAYQLWADTTNGLLKQRNAANAAWLVRGTLAETFVISRSTNTILGVGDYGRTFVFTSTFTQTFTAAATLTDGWWVEIRNDGTGVITLDPNAAETVDGVATIDLLPGQSCIVNCNGASFKTVGRQLDRGAPIAAGRNIAAKNNAATPNTKLDISADELTVEDANGNVKVLKTVAVTIDFGVTGANGIDTGTQALSTWYYGWIIAKEDGTVAGLGSLSNSAPTLPSGYTYKALATAARSNASTQFIKYRQFGNRVTYEARQSVLSVGTATVETTVSTATFVPPNALSAYVDLWISSNNASAVASAVTWRIVSGSDWIVAEQDTDTVSRFSEQVVDIPNLSQQFFYLWSAAGATSRSANALVLGFKLPLGGE